MRKDIFFIILIFLISIPTALAAVVEITIEYNVTAECSGSVVLTLNPSIVVRRGSVTPSASGLSNCDGKTVYFKSNSCVGTQVSSCSVSGSGCTGSAFTAPDTIATYTYYACIDKNSDNDFADSGESISKNLTIVSAIPSVSALTFSPSLVDLIEGSTKLITMSATVTDTDGASDIILCSGYLWNATVSPPLTLGKATYTNATCSLSGCSGNSCNCNCSFRLQYYDTSGMWTGNLTAKDSSNANGTNKGIFGVNALVAVRIANGYGPINSTNPYPIVFGTIKVGETKSAESNPLKITNTGNVKLKISVYGEDHVGVSDPTWVLKVENMTYNSTATGMGASKQLTNSSSYFYPTGGLVTYPNILSGIIEKATFYIYNYLTIPADWRAQVYRSTYYLDAEAM